MSKMIKRDLYFDKMIRVLQSPDIKVITGVRRSGKSKLLESLKKYIEINISEYNIIHVNYNLKKYDNLLDGDSLYKYVSNKYEINKQNFILIDEIQKCNGFEDVINSFHAEEKYTVYITGSNAFLLSSDLATLFTGRTFEIEIYPFSLKEYIEYSQKNNNDIKKDKLINKNSEMSEINNLKSNVDFFDEYINYGGMAGSYIYDNLEDKDIYLKKVFSTLVLRDIVQKYKIKDNDLLNKLSNYLLDNISCLTSSRKIENTLKSNKHTADHKTILKYIDYLCKAFAFYKVRRYDIKGKRYLASQDKYYVVDHSFRRAILGRKNMDYGRILENIVAMELLRRRYEIYVGTLYNKEIDFVAMRGDEQLYIQVTDNINDDKTLEREISPLLSIKDGYKKIIIARLNHEGYKKDGIEIIDISDWLLEV